MTRSRMLLIWHSGFTLLEAVISIALLGLIMSSLVAITGQWLPNWHRGFARVQGNDAIATALDRIVVDIAASEYVPLNRALENPLFIGKESSVIFIRTAIGPNVRPGLDIVRIGETVDKTGRLLVRSRTAFAPLKGDVSRTEQLQFADPVVFLRAPYRLRFSYAGVDGVWHERWQNERLLPAYVRLEVRNTDTGQAPLVSTVVSIRVNGPAACVKGTCELAGNDQGESRQRPDGRGQQGR